MLLANNLSLIIRQNKLEFKKARALLHPALPRPDETTAKNSGTFAEKSASDYK